jgi:hypothetical protein
VHIVFNISLIHFGFIYIMGWNLFLVIVSIAMMMIFIGVCFVLPATEAEVISEKLSPLIGIDKDTIRGHLEEILFDGGLYRTVISSSPLALLSILLITRLIVDNRQRGDQRRQASGLKTLSDGK